MVVCARVKSCGVRFTAVLCSPITLCPGMCLEVLSNVQTRVTNDKLSLNHLPCKLALLSALTGAPRVDVPLCPICFVETYLECTALPSHPLASESLGNPLLFVILAPRHPLYVYGYPFPESSIKVARDSCDVTHSLKQASIHTSHVHASKKLYKSTHCTLCNQPAHTNAIMLYTVKCSLYVVRPFLGRKLHKSWSTGVKR